VPCSNPHHCAHGRPTNSSGFVLVVSMDGTWEIFAGLSNTTSGNRSTPTIALPIASGEGGDWQSGKWLQVRLRSNSTCQKTGGGSATPAGAIHAVEHTLSSSRKHLSDEQPRGVQCRAEVEATINGKTLARLSVDLGTGAPIRGGAWFGTGFHAASFDDILLSK
jgi:hypothetical protein